LTSQGLDLGAAWTWPNHDSALLKLAHEVNAIEEDQYMEGYALSQYYNNSIADKKKTFISKIGRNIGSAGDGSKRFYHGAASIVYNMYHNLLQRDEQQGTETISLQLNSKVENISQFIASASDDENNEAANKDRGKIRVEAINTEDGANQSYLADIVVIALPPKLAINSIIFSPDLSVEKQIAMNNTPIWMANAGKVIFIYQTRFWNYLARKPWKSSK